MEQLVTRIKDERTNSLFVIADLTDERPSCYFEAGLAEALKIPVIYVASEESISNYSTKIHFDIHMNVNFFTNIEQLVDMVNSTIIKNKAILFSKDKTLISSTK
jgi:nucleoside 2-deoxyribosyltransferase